VLARHKSRFEASLLWLVEAGAVTVAEVDGVRSLREYRNEIAHELPRMLVEPGHDIDAPSSTLQTFSGIVRPVELPTVMKLVLKKIVRFLACGAVFAFIGSACVVHDAATVPTRTSAQPNEVVLYLGGAERQCETDEQRAEIVSALEDLQHLSASDLARKRYADYTMVPGQWTLATLLEKYFVPSTPYKIDPVAFYRDAQDPAAHAVIAEQLRAIHEQRQVTTGSTNISTAKATSTADATHLHVVKTCCAEEAH
jgi:hypothetical protein